MAVLSRKVRKSQAPDGSGLRAAEREALERWSVGVLEYWSAGPAKSRERGEDAKDKHRTPNTEHRTPNTQHRTSKADRRERDQWSGFLTLILSNRPRSGRSTHL